MTAEAEARQEPPPPPRTSSATLGSGREDSGDGRLEQQPLTKTTRTEPWPPGRRRGKARLETAAPGGGQFSPVSRGPRLRVETDPGTESDSS